MSVLGYNETDRELLITAFGFDKPEHEIVWEFDDGIINGHLVCNDADCQHRYVCHEGCEVMYDIRKTETGYHHAVNEYEDRPSNIWHDMVRGDECNFVLFIDASDLPEANEEPEPFEIGRTPVEAVWHGEDGATWKRAS